MARRKTRYTGVYERASSVNRFQGKADIAYDVCYKIDGKLTWFCAGWRSEGMTAGEAVQIRADLIRQAKHKVKVGMTFDEAWKKYVDDWLSQKKNAKTDIGLYRNHIAAEIGAVPLEKVGPQHIQEILSHTADLSDQTRKHIIGLIRRVYRKMITWRFYSGEIPTTGFTIGKVDNDRRRFLSADEAARLLAELDKCSPQFADVCRVSLYAGLRLGEIFALRVQDIDLDARIIYVMDAKAGSREAIINEELKKVLKKYVAGRKSEEFVFTQGDGKTPMKYINQAFVRAVKRLGFNDGITDSRRKVVFHTLRHTFASWLVQKGVPLYTVADLMGHSTLSMTQRYAKLAPDTRTKAVEKLNDVFKSNGEQ